MDSIPETSEVAPPADLVLPRVAFVFDEQESSYNTAQYPHHMKVLCCMVSEHLGLDYRFQLYFYLGFVLPYYLEWF